MQQIIARFLKKVTEGLEFVISIILAIGIILLCFRMIGVMSNIPNLEIWPNYDDLLETCFNLIIGVELIRMMYYHTPDTVFEVLLFAIARQIITDHSSVWGSLVGVTAIAVLFATRKYLFCEFDISDAIIFRASAKVKAINRLLDLNIPHEQNETLMDVVNQKLAENEQTARVGACVYFHDCGLRVAKLHNEKISRIEVIRSIH
jgi:uncharacterized membrane protein (DUF373 family)